METPSHSGSGMKLGKSQSALVPILTAQLDVLSTHLGVPFNVGHPMEGIMHFQ